MTPILKKAGPAQAKGGAGIGTGLETSVKAIVDKLADREKRQDEVIPLARQVVRDCANCIKTIHASEKDNAKACLAAAAKGLQQLKGMSDGIESTGAIAPQEYVEALCLMAVFEHKALPTLEEAGVDELAYLNGIADCVGELRRELQLSLRRGDHAEAERYYDVMDAVYENLMTVRFSSSLVGSLKRKQDVARGQLEQARSELLRK